jgi:hypothetical protein
VLIRSWRLTEELWGVCMDQERSGQGIFDSWWAEIFPWYQTLSQFLYSRNGLKIHRKVLRQFQVCLGLKTSVLDWFLNFCRNL